MGSSDAPPPVDLAERMTPIRLVQSLRSTTCPACGAVKESGKSMCGGCYFRLPTEQRSALYRRVGEGYEEAMLAGFRTLGRTVFVQPAEAARKRRRLY